MYLPPQQKPAVPIGRGVEARRAVKKERIRGRVRDWRVL